MGKRLIRIFQKEIPTRITALLNQELSMVLINNKTIKGILRKIDHTTFTVEGGLHETHKVTLEEIIEIIYDKEAAY